MLRDKAALLHHDVLHHDSGLQHVGQPHHLHRGGLHLDDQLLAVYDNDSKVNVVNLLLGYDAFIFTTIQQLRSLDTPLHASTAGLHDDLPQELLNASTVWLNDDLPLGAALILLLAAPAIFSR